MRFEVGDALLQPAAEGAEGDEELGGAAFGVGGSAVGALLVAEEAAGEAGRQEVDHEGEAGAFVLAHGEEAAGGEGDGGIVGRTPLGVERPAEGDALASL